MMDVLAVLTTVKFLSQEQVPSAGAYALGSPSSTVKSPRALNRA